MRCIVRQVLFELYTKCEDNRFASFFPFFFLLMPTKFQLSLFFLRFLRKRNHRKNSYEFLILTTCKQTAFSHNFLSIFWLVKDCHLAISLLLIERKLIYVQQNRLLQYILALKNMFCFLSLGGIRSVWHFSYVLCTGAICILTPVVSLCTLK